MGAALGFIISITLFTVVGCHQPLKNPENLDPIYKDLKAKKEKVDADLVKAEKDVERSKKALDEAPIRTGQRQDAQDDYFTNKHEQQRQIELYRYMALKLQERKTQDQIEYQTSFAKKEPWPDPKAYQIYVLEQKLATAPREWSPDVREKARHPAAIAKKSEEEGGE